MATTTKAADAIPTNTQLNRARYHGADAALTYACSPGTAMSDDRARSTIAGDLDWATPPNLSGQRPCDQTRIGLADDVLGIDPANPIPEDVLDALADAWEQGRDLVWADALRAIAHRTLGNITTALAIERANERIADRLREAIR